MGIDDTIGLAGDGGIHNVGDCNCARAFSASFALSGGGVRGLARLGDDDSELAPPDERITVFKLARVIHIHRHVYQILDHVLPGHAGVPARTRGHNIDAP